MARTIRFFYDVPGQQLVAGFDRPPARAALPSLLQGIVYRTEHYFGEYDATTGAWRYLDPAGWGFRFAVGAIGARPSAGTWTVSDGVHTTAGIAITATAADVQSALTSAGMTGWTVAKPGDSRWTFTATSNGNQALLTVNTSLLTPSSAADVYALQEGTASAPEIQEIELTANPAGYQAAWTAISSSTATVEVLQAGASGTNAQQRITFDPLPVGGSYVIKMPNGKLTAAIPALSTGDVVQEAISAVTGYTDAGVISVEGGGSAPLVITFQGSLGETAQSAVTVQTDGLISAPGLAGVVSLATAAAKNMVRGQASAVQTILEAHRTVSGSEEPLVQTSIQIGPSLISAATGSSTPLPLISVGLVNGSAVGVVGLTGGGSTKLDGVQTLGVMTSAIYTVTDATHGFGVWELVASTDAEDAAAGVVRPDDFNSSTNAHVWIRRL